MAGVDFPREEERARASSSTRAAGRRGTIVGNDTFAVLRAGTERGWGVAVVCGAGINCVGVAPRRAARSLPGARARSPATGAAATTSGSRRSRRRRAARTAAARGRRSSSAVPAHFGFDTPHELAEAIHAGRSPSGGVLELAPRRLRRGRARRAVAAGIVDRLAAEVVALARRRARRGSGSTTSRSRWCSAAGCCSAATRACSSAIEHGCASVGRALVVRVDRRAADRRRGAARARRARRGRRRRRRELARASSTPRDDSRLSEVARWLRCATSRRRGSTRAPTRRRSNALDLDIADGEFMVLVGPSGSGKTTALRMLAGLEEVDAGAIYIGDRDVTDVAAEGPRHRDGVPELRALPVPDRRGEHRLPAQDRAREEGRARAARARGRRAARADASTSSASRASSPAGSASGSRWAARSSASRACS